MNNVPERDRLLDDVLAEEIEPGVHHGSQYEARQRSREGQHRNRRYL